MSARMSHFKISTSEVTMIYSILKTLLIFISSVMIMAVSVWYGFSGLFSPKNMDEQLQPDAASEFYDSKGDLIYTL